MCIVLHCVIIIIICFITSRSIVSSEVKELRNTRNVSGRHFFMCVMLIYSLIIYFTITGQKWQVWMKELWLPSMMYGQRNFVLWFCQQSQMSQQNYNPSCPLEILFVQLNVLSHNNFELYSIVTRDAQPSQDRHQLEAEYAKAFCYVCYNMFVYVAVITS